MEYLWTLLISTIAALIIAGGAFLAAREGGKMAAKASREGVREMLEGQRQLDKNRQREIMQGFLEAVYEELYALWNKINEEVGIEIKNFKKTRKEGEELIL